MARPLEQLVGESLVPLAGRHPRILLAVAWATSTLLLFLFRPGYTFPPFDVLDSWVYTGYQWNLRGHISEFGTVYYGSRLTLILPGALLHSILPPLAANVCFKLMASALLTTAIATVAWRARGLPTALLAVVLSVFCPQVIYALHTDYMDLAVILYGALTMAAITLAKDSRHWPAWIFFAGVAFACMGITNLSAIAMPGLGIAVYHLLWLNWGFRRQLTSVGLYLLAAGATIAIGGVISRLLGGPFFFLKPQVDMIFYFHNLEKNPWTPPNWNWLRGAIWLILPVTAVLWGLVRSWANSATAPTPTLIRALTGALIVSLAVALNLELRGIGVLAYSFYASFQLCMALPLLAVCGAVPGRTGAVSLPWLIGSSVVLAAAILFVDSATVAGAVQSQLPFLPAGAPLLVLAAGACLLGAVLVARWTTRARPELLAVGLVACSIPLGFHGPALSDRLPERYGSVHTAFQTLARELPLGYRFWLHPDQSSGLPLSSTMLYGYRLFTLQMFPAFEAYNVSHHTLVIPCLPHQGAAVLAFATAELDKLRIDVTAPRVISIPGELDTGMDLVCFKMVERPVAVADLIAEAERGRVVMDLRFSADPPYTDEIIQTTFPPGSRTINSSRGYPVFTPTDPQDYLWTPWHAIPNPQPGVARELKLVADMPAEGLCICVVQTEGYREIRRIPLIKQGRSLHLIAVPPDVATLRIYLTTEGMAPTALPTALTIYAPP